MDKRYLTVTQLNRYLKYKFDHDEHLNQIYLKGEISNFKAHTRGHYYFTLKDDGSRIKAIMFARNASLLKFVPEDGMKVLVTGKVTVYEENGDYQIYVTDMLEDGIGNLHVAFEQLKKKLQQEGLFDVSKKKPIPRMPRRIGIVTASTGAAIRDILTTLGRRWPIVETILFPALVQGKDAAEDIARKIEIANRYDLDVLIVGRGGGSLEDLWPFNEEVVARAIYQSRIPVISAVGHEPDVTISDFVADLRAATPTAAAERAVVDRETVLDYLMKARGRGYQAIMNRIQQNRVQLLGLRDSYVLKRPSNIYEVKEQKLSMLIERLNLGMQNVLEKNRVRFYQIENSYVLNNPRVLYYSRIENFKNLYKSLNQKMNSLITDYQVKVFQLKNSYVLTNPQTLYQFREQKLVGLVEKLEVLNPMNTLKRGYTIVKFGDKVISDISDVQENDELVVEFKNGKATTKVVKVSEEDE